MCGFAAFFEPGRRFPLELVIQASQDLVHRGPDSEGIIHETGHALIFRRLAILDPTAASDQPFSDPTGRYKLLFNGEIYNYKEIRRELKSLGEQFSTTGDTEVILKGYIRYGQRIFSKLEGMFALVIWDSLQQEAVAARDPYGIKPLYMARKKAFIGFSSEMRPLRRVVGSEVDVEALVELLVFGFAGGRRSNIERIESVPGGTIVRVHNGSVVESRFSDPLDTLAAAGSLDIGESEAVDLIEEQLRRSVTAHLQSDVGYAVQLSGGIDSSLITALAVERSSTSVRSFGIKLDAPRHDESLWRQQVIDRYQTDHHEIALGAKDFADALPRAIRHLEGPTAHGGGVMLMLLCDEIRRSDKVVLTGEGADEFFGGYHRYARWQSLRNWNMAAHLIPRAVSSRLKRPRRLHLYAHQDAAVLAGVYHDHLALLELFPDLSVTPGYRDAVAARFESFPLKMNAVDQTSYLSSLLLRQDKLSMAASVEARVPFTHYPLARVVNSLPVKLRLPGGTTKPLLKRVAEPWLPHRLVHRRKVGLTLPYDRWLADDNNLGRYLEQITDPSSRIGEFADMKKLRRVVHDFRRQGPPSTRRGLNLLRLISVGVWLESLQQRGDALLC